MSICLSHGGPSVYATGLPSRELLVATTDGIVFLARSQSTGDWHVSCRALEGKHISALLIESSRGMLLAGTHGDGLYASEDRGRTWQRKDRGIEFPNVYSLNTVHVGAQLRVYAGTEPAHLLVSTDGGEDWRELASLRSVPSVKQWTFPGPPHIAHVKHIAFAPGLPETIYVGIEVGGLLKSVDGGESWRELAGVYADVHRVVIPPSRPEHLYVSGGNGIYSSPDGGQGWEQLTTRTARIGYPDALIIHPEREALMFMAGAASSPTHWRTARTANSRIGRSRDGGRNWEMLDGGLPEHIRGNVEAMSMNVWRGGFSLFAGTTDGEVFFSDDEGERWATIARGLPPVSKGGHYRNLRSPDSPEPVTAR